MAVGATTPGQSNRNLRLHERGSLFAAEEVMYDMGVRISLARSILLLAFNSLYTCQQRRPSLLTSPFPPRLLDNSRQTFAFRLSSYVLVK